MKTVTNSQILKEAHKQMLDRTSRTVYVPVSDNTYYNGQSFRVRVTRNGIRTSRNFKLKTAALSFRNELLSV